MLSAWFEWLDPATIQALGTIAIGVLGAWIAWVQSDVKTLKAQRKLDLGIIRAFTRWSGAQGVHIALLCGLLRQHAPHVEIPPEPQMPDELRDEVA